LQPKLPFFFLEEFVLLVKFCVFSILTESVLKMQLSNYRAAQFKTRIIRSIFVLTNGMACGETRTPGQVRHPGQQLMIVTPVPTPHEKKKEKKQRACLFYPAWLLQDRLSEGDSAAKRNTAGRKMKTRLVLPGWKGWAPRVQTPMRRAHSVFLIYGLRDPPGQGGDACLFFLLRLPFFFVVVSWGSWTRTRDARADFAFGHSAFFAALSISGTMSAPGRRG
jgi:hypothetical protein